MARNRNIELSTIIGKDSIFTGDLSVQGGLRVDGEINGKIESTGFVVIGPSGYAKSGIIAQECLISGKVDGDVIVEEGLELDKNSRIIGDITAKKLKVHTGAIFIGSCSMEHEDLTESETLGQTENDEETQIN